ncbi:serine/threonine-protein kinase [Streptomyces sp. NPDC007369]|uniref:serine/threonine-protein kinase n=1 Tax=Streptomyces sp. NPDC007369 TaxID=3154589 RepID=UPI0033DB8F82
MAGNDVFPAGLALRYKPCRVLGRGGMGVVFEAEDTQLKRRVAVKVLSVFGTGLPEEMQRRFVHEAIALARISHSGVVGIHDSGVDADSGTPYLVMELLDGVDLSMLATGRPLPVPAACWIAVSVLDALEAVHRSGVLHRDVKPGNVRIRPDGRVVLYDFGVAAVADERRITATADGLIGTAQYMAPERIRGLPSSGATDLYGVGACLHFMLTGSAPFGNAEGMDLGALVLRAAKGLPSLRETAPHLPEGLVGVVDALCATDYRARPAGAAVAASLLHVWAAGGETQLVRLSTASAAPHAAADTVAARPGPPPVRVPAPAPAPAPTVTVDDVPFWSGPSSEMPEYDWRTVDVAGGLAQSPAAEPAPPEESGLSEVTRRLVHSRMTRRSALARQREAVGLVLRGQFQEASRLLSEVIQFSHELMGPSHPTTLAAEYWKAVCLARLGEASSALELFARVDAHNAQERNASDA